MIKNKSSPFTLLAAALLCTGLAQAQESVNAAGGESTGSGGSASYSIGQVAYTMHEDATGSVAQGVQQPYEIFTVGISEFVSAFSTELFPNPASDQLTLKLSNNNNEELWYELFDSTGKRLVNEQVKTDNTLIDLSDLPSAIYYVQLMTSNNIKVQTFKIIKN
jgi:hypothetical protein